MSIYYQDGTVTVHHGDCLRVLRSDTLGYDRRLGYAPPLVPDESIDSVVTDPPYGLSNSTTQQVTDTIVAWATGDREYVPGGKGFLGKSWDAFVPPVAVWDECMRVLKPGGHMLVFAGSRTHDLMTLGIRLAGFEIRDSLAWVFGAGFPKSRDIGRAVDQESGAKRELKPWLTRDRVGVFAGDDGKTTATRGNLQCPDCLKWKFAPDYCKCRRDNGPQTPEAARWEGWGTAMKPAIEPVVCARKPFSAVPLDWRLAANVHHALAGLLWLSLSPAKHAELSSLSSRAEPRGAWCVSARVSAALDTSREGYDETATFNSQATASTCLSIASSWSNILAALSAPTTTSTTSTASSTTTALRTLNSLLGPITSQTTMPVCECLTHGQPSSAESVAQHSSGVWSRWLHTLSASVPESAIEGIALAAASALAQVAESLSADEAVGSSVVSGATTRADVSGSPAIEPVVLARKPLAAGTVAGNVLRYGTGALNIDATRIGTDERPVMVRTSTKVAASSMSGASTGATSSGETTTSGRWPANVMFDEHQARALDQQSGATTSRTGKPRNANAGDGWGMTAAGTEYDDEGGASRFFLTAGPDPDTRFLYHPKAGTDERPRVNGVAHPTVKPLTVLKWLTRLVTPPGGTILEPFAGSGTTVEACITEGFRCVAVEREAEYLPLIEARITRQRDPVRAIELAQEDLGLFADFGEDG